MGSGSTPPYLNELAASVENRFQSSKSPVVVLLPGQQLLRQREHRHNLRRQVLCTSKPFGAQYHLEFHMDNETTITIGGSRSDVVSCKPKQNGLNILSIKLSTDGSASKRMRSRVAYIPGRESSLLAVEVDAKSDRKRKYVDPPHFCGSKQDLEAPLNSA